MAVKQLPWDSAVVIAVCDVLASTDYPGLTWSEIVQVLSLSGVREIEKASNKRNDLTRDGRPGPHRRRLTRPWTNAQPSKHRSKSAT